jgi:hypothetical protein
MHYGTARTRWRALSSEHQAPSSTEKNVVASVVWAYSHVLTTGPAGLSQRQTAAAGGVAQHIGWRPAADQARPVSKLYRVRCRDTLVSLSKRERTLVLMHVAALRTVLDEDGGLFGVQSEGEDHHVGQRTAIVKHQIAPPHYHHSVALSSDLFSTPLFSSRSIENLDDTAYLRLMAHRCAGARRRCEGPQMTFID